MATDRLFNGYDLAEMEEPLKMVFISAAKGDHVALSRWLRERPELANRPWGYINPLDVAVRSGDFDTVKLLLEHGALPEKSLVKWLDDPLTKARDRGYEKIAALLNSYMSQNYNIREEGNRIAEWIRQRNNDAVIRELEQHPEWIHAGDERGNTPLHWAVLTRNLSLIGAMIERGADPNAKRLDGAAPLHLAIEGDYWYRDGRDVDPNTVRNKWFIAGYLTALGAEYDIWSAASVGDAERIGVLLKEHPELANAKSPTGKRPLSYASRSGHDAAVKLLLECGADPNAEESGAPSGSALWLAVNGNWELCAKMLLDHGADPNAEVDAGGSCLYIAARKGHDRLVQLLYTYGASMKIDGACDLGRIDLVSEMLAANPALVHSGGDYGPLCQAAGSGHFDLVKLLIRKGADLNARWYANNYMGYAMNQSPEMVRLLLESGADPNNANWLGVTYLHKAAWLGSEAIAKLLLDYGADPNAVDEEYGATPLGWAAKWGKADIVRLLLERGADPRRAEGEWTQPLAWAKRKGHADIAAILENAMAK
jgi:ankyrin repeat protein